MLAWKRLGSLMLSCSILPFGIKPVPAMAQAGPTEVAEPAVDDFGLERKTGRFKWSGQQIIAIGEGNSALDITVIDPRSPPWASEIWPARSEAVNIDQPRLISVFSPDPSRPIVGVVTGQTLAGESQTRTNKTVEYFGGTDNFQCDTSSCLSDHLSGETLVPSGTGYWYTDRQGIKIYFELGRSKIVYPDGKEVSYEALRFRKNNFGYLVKYGGSALQAVNQAVDYCLETSTASCANLTASRNASITELSGARAVLTDPLGAVTTLRWENKTAKRDRTPLGAPCTGLCPYNYNITERYLVGVKYPGSAVDDIVITYNTIDPAVDTHDDIWVTSIKKAGIVANYEYERIFPYGAVYEAPPEVPPDTRYFLVENGEAPPEPILVQPAPDTDGPGQYGIGSFTLQIRAFVAGEMIGETFAEKPPYSYSLPGRVLHYVVDPLNRKTEILPGPGEKIGGLIYPEGSKLAVEYDGRENIIKSTMVAKPGSGLPDLVTFYVYASSCTPATQASCNKPVRVTDPKGQITDYTYNDRGQLLTETKPAPTPGAARPTVTNSYMMRTAYIKGAASSLVAAGPPISLLVRSSACLTQSSCVGTTDEVITEYDYGPITGLNNLLLRGQTVKAANGLGQMETLRTCYGYNYFGEKISETEPAANLSVCP